MINRGGVMSWKNKTKAELIETLDDADRSRKDIGDNLNYLLREIISLDVDFEDEHEKLHIIEVLNSTLTDVNCIHLLDKKWEEE
jgi:hypothetical protein